MKRLPAVDGQKPYTRLVVQLIAILSIAILPLGLISVYQTSNVLRESRSLSATALLQRTQSMTSAERELIQSAIGAANAVSSVATVLRANVETCNTVLAALDQQNEQYIFVGYVTEDGVLHCSSSGQRGQLSKDDIFADSQANHAPRVETRPSEVLNGRMVLSVSVPVIDNGTYLGAVWIAIPYAIANELLVAGNDQAVDLLVFDAKGQVLATQAFDDDRRMSLPADMQLIDLVQGDARTFQHMNRAGVERDFAVVPIVEGIVYGLGSWEPQRSGALLGSSSTIALYFPLLMWAVAMVVAYFGINRLVVRHIYRLRNWMRMYSAGRIDFTDARLDNPPEELEVVAEAFRRMTRRLSEHEHRREEDLAEKTVLLKEVHHRVKNNLQLISSIMNMQIRKSRTPEARLLLRRVQDRVMALAAIHRTLYTARSLSVVQANDLLESIVSQLVKAGGMEDGDRHISVSTNICPAEITPDQAVPLCLLATEAAMNAVKYAGPAGGKPAWMQMVLHDQGDRVYCLSVVNSRDESAEPVEDASPSGLGSQLIDSFVMQLDGTLEINDLPDRYELHVTFTAHDADTFVEQVDY
ncbi:sensor histidine kinase [Roseovarius sp. ZX-A-9]|uniref:sensor histidine kinase n=1 Tax=Roseovarius sp. ZX-A-9 TaxID=3014783 RepID=UPI00232B9EBC|nr:histidine kinase dimerization/phosphoacceptor domain -containing protein [Roseovarius sp. ZX-A-9]